MSIPHSVLPSCWTRNARSEQFARRNQDGHARRKRALLGPLWSAEQRRVGRGIGKLSEAMDGRVVCRPARIEQRRAPGGQDVRRARNRGVLLFGYSSLAQARESSSAAGRRAKPRKSYFTLRTSSPNT